MARTGVVSHPPPQAIVAAATLACLLPFLGRAFHVDDPLFLWTAEQILRSPGDFYGFDVNWYGIAQPAFEVAKNPPLASYLLAAAALPFGFREVPLHAVFLLPALLAALGTLRLARRLCPNELVAALVTVASPAFLVCATGVMGDVAMLALFVWSLSLWIEGLDRGSPARLAAAALLVAAAALTKYFGVALVPLLALYALARRRPAALAWLLVPLLLLALYQLYTEHRYGLGLLLDSAVYARTTRHRLRSGLQVFRVGTGVLAFAGGALLPVLFYAPRLWSRRGLALGAGAALLLALAATRSADVLAPLAERVPPWALGLQIGVLAALGGAVLGLAIADLRRFRDPEALLLFAWVAGTFAFAGFFNWATNTRSLLPLCPAVGILVARRLAVGPARRSRLTAAAPLLPALAVALLVAWSDAATANANRAVAARLDALYGGGPGTLWFQGHWGFQYYMERHGHRPLSYAGAVLRPPDRMAVPHDNAGVQMKPVEAVLRSLVTVEVPLLPPVATMQATHGAGFHYHGMGPLPFVFGPRPRVLCDVYVLTAPIVTEF